MEEEKKSIESDILCSILFFFIHKILSHFGFYVSSDQMGKSLALLPSHIILKMEEKSKKEEKDTKKPYVIVCGGTEAPSNVEHTV